MTSNHPFRALCELASFDNGFLGKKTEKDKKMELKLLGIYIQGVYYLLTNFHLNLIIPEKSRFHENLS